MLNQLTIERTEQSEATARAATCAQCRYFCNEICRLKAEADFDDAAKTHPNRKACHFADPVPF